VFRSSKISVLRARGLTEAVLVSGLGLCRDEDLFEQTGFPTVEAFGVECLREPKVFIVQVMA